MSGKRGRAYTLELRSADRSMVVTQCRNSLMQLRTEIGLDTLLARIKELGNEKKALEQETGIAVSLRAIDNVNDNLLFYLKGKSQARKPGFTSSGDSPPAAD